MPELVNVMDTLLIDKSNVNEFKELVMRNPVHDDPLCMTKEYIMDTITTLLERKAEFVNTMHTYLENTLYLDEKNKIELFDSVNIVGIIERYLSYEDFKECL